MDWKLIFRSLKSKKMFTAMLSVLSIMVIYRFLAHIPIPLAEPTQLKQLVSSAFSSEQVLGFLDLLSGGALSSFSIMIMGLGPYINASIIMQILSKAVPRLEELNQEGESGRQKINQYTRILTVPLGIIQSVGLIFILRQQTVASSLGIDITKNASPAQWILMIVSMVAASILLMWLGELITEQGVGNGISLIIFAGIVSRLPSTIYSLIEASISNSQGVARISLFGQQLPLNARATYISIAILIATLVITYCLVKLNEAQRIVTVHYAKRVKGNRTYGGITTILPIKLISAGVIPIIFAFAFLSMPQFAGRLIENSSTTWMANLGKNLVDWFASPGSQEFLAKTGYQAWIYPVAYFLLVVVFTYFYTGIVFNSKEIAENLQKQGGFVSGVQPGERTEVHLKAVVNRLNLFGATSLGILAMIPIIAEKMLGTSQLSISGTGLLIVVSVALETLRQVQSKALMETYDFDENNKKPNNKKGLPVLSKLKLSKKTRV
ncbi:MAG TPA: preprotein translocase subunit SecY [Candidatus Saccharibacteria bacterium]|nr:preprotein translocase subunit SecY [Candidatus Saccharibacteria bacterium]